MKNCVIFFNCHGGQIYKQLYSSKIFINQYKVDFISLYDYLEGYKYSNEKDLIQEHLTLIKEADLIILQYIKINKKKIISHEYINSLLKKETKIILIPHYTFSGYNYPYDIFNDEFISGEKDKKELESYINNLFINDKDKIITHIIVSPV